MKNYILLLMASLCLIVTVNQSIKAQTSFSFGYDASGNRLTRTIVLKSASISKDSVELKKATTPLEDQIGLRTVRIYPNPTKGILRVEITNTSESQANIQVYTLGGSLLLQQRLDGNNASIDLSGHSAGIYLLKISIANQTAVWKIIKE